MDLCNFYFTERVKFVWLVQNISQAKIKKRVNKQNKSDVITVDWEMVRDVLKQLLEYPCPTSK